HAIGCVRGFAAATILPRQAQNRQSTPFAMKTFTHQCRPRFQAMCRNRVRQNRDPGAVFVTRPPRRGDWLHGSFNRRSRMVRHAAAVAVVMLLSPAWL